MSLVSRRIDTFAITGKKHVPTAVGFKKGGDDPMFVQPPQVAHFNVSKSIRKAIPAPPPKPSTNAPLMTLQEGSDLKGGIFAPQSVGIPLKIPVYRPTTISHMEDADEVSTDFQHPLPLDMGIRPGIRPLTLSKVSEPSAPMFRPGGHKIQVDRPAHTEYRDRYSELLAEMRR